MQEDELFQKAYKLCCSLIDEICGIYQSYGI